jgi:predicted small metal-binding protein
MERVLRCKDVGLACDFEARGKTDEEILEKAAEHTIQDHEIERITKEYMNSWRILIREE